jgi:hypothetical protein
MATIGALTLTLVESVTIEETRTQATSFGWGLYAVQYVTTEAGLPPGQQGLLMKFGQDREVVVSDGEDILVIGLPLVPHRAKPALYVGEMQFRTRLTPSSARFDHVTNELHVTIIDGSDQDVLDVTLTPAHRVE